MRYTVLGRSGLRVSELALGAMTFGEAWDWSVSKETSRSLIDCYLEHGGNFIDTANGYTNGESERILGEVLEGRRDQVVVATKYTIHTEPHINAGGNHRRSLVTSLESSLRQLRTDRIDLLWVHMRDTLTPVDEVMRALDDQVRLGKVLHVGVSDWPAWEVSQANTLAQLRGWSPFVGLQIRYSLLDRTVERELLPMALAFDLAVVAWGALGQGRLSGKYARGEPGGRLSNAAYRKSLEPGLQSDGAEHPVVGEVMAVADEIGEPAAGVALAWLRLRAGTIIPLLGATRVEQLETNLRSAEIVLTAEQQDRLERVSRPELGFPHDAFRTERLLARGYGDAWREVDDRRRGAKRSVGDSDYVPIEL